MVIIGAAMNHWYHMDMNYRGVINLLMMCGCIGHPAAAGAHYVGQEKLRPQTGWTALAFALDWIRPPAAEQHRSSTRTPTSGATSPGWPRSCRRARSAGVLGTADRLQRARRTDGLAAHRRRSRPTAGGGAGGRRGRVDPWAYAVTQL